MTFFASMLIKSIKLLKTEKGQPIKLDWAILRKLLPFLFAGCIRQSVISLCSWRLRPSFSLFFLSVHFVYMSWILFYFTLSFRNVYINKNSFFFFNWPFWFFPNIRKKNRIKNKPSKQSILLITRRKHPPPPNTHTLNMISLQLSSLMAGKRKWGWTQRKFRGGLAMCTDLLHTQCVL